MGKVREGKYGGCTWYTCMKIKQLNSADIVLRRVGGMRENDCRRGKSN
jgi:hypothetical protein